MRSGGNYEIEWMPEVDSTNLEMKRRIGKGLPDGKILATSNQSAGRGRAGRVWQSGRGQNLCLSLLVAQDAPAADLPSLGMAAVLGVDDLMRELRIGSRPKWPNDLRVEGRKICGILSEGLPGAAILGIGINVNMGPAEAQAIDQPATSILIESGRTLDPRDVLRSLMPHLEKRTGIWRRLRFAGLREDWIDRVEGLGREIDIVNGENTLRGRLEGFGPHGECLLRMEDGRVEAVWSGDARMRTDGPRGGGER